MLHESFSPADAVPLQRSRRESVFIVGSLIVDGQSEPISIRVRNLSSDGMMVDLPRGPAKGERVIVSLKRLEPVHGEVAWNDGKHVGVHFDTIIDTLAVRNVAKPREMLPVYLRPALTPPRSFR